MTGAIVFFCRWFPHHRMKQKVFNDGTTKKVKWNDYSEARARARETNKACQLRPCTARQSRGRWFIGQA
jgi:hypothetical protein